MRLPSYLALFACVGGGYLWLRDEATPAPNAPRPATRSAKIALPQIVMRADVPDELELPILPSDEPDEADEEIRGLEAPSQAEFAMVFMVDGVSYLRLSEEEEATAHGAARLTETDGMTSVVAPVAVTALPDTYRSWAGRSVLVNGDCRARVVGFAEVSRVTGEAGDPYAYDEHGNPPEPTPWTVELVRESNVTLAAQLEDGCYGAWARAESESAPAVAAVFEDPALESAALADLLAKTAGDDETQLSWKDQGGEGDWRDHVGITSVAWQHPLTEEKWVFVQAARGGSCGDPTISLMAAYRVRADGTVRRAADLHFAHDTIEEIVDLDGDGQPELLIGGGGSSTDLVDLTNAHHESIYVPNHSHGCGC